MKKTIKQWTTGILAMALTMTFAGTTVPAQTVKAQTVKDSKEVKKQKKEGHGEAREATKAFREVMNVPVKGIPR